MLTEAVMMKVRVRIFLSFRNHNRSRVLFSQKQYCQTNSGTSPVRFTLPRVHAYDLVGLNLIDSAPFPLVDSALFFGSNSASIAAFTAKSTSIYQHKAHLTNKGAKLLLLCA